MQTIEFNLEWKLKLQNRFLNYVKIYSTSDPESDSTPSTPQQWNIAKYIFEELCRVTNGFGGGGDEKDVDIKGYYIM